MIILLFIQFFRVVAAKQGPTTISTLHALPDNPNIFVIKLWFIAKRYTQVSFITLICMSIHQSVTKKGQRVTLWVYQIRRRFFVNSGDRKSYSEFIQMATSCVRHKFTLGNSVFLLFKIDMLRQGRQTNCPSNKFAENICYWPAKTW